MASYPDQMRIEASEVALSGADSLNISYSVLQLLSSKFKVVQRCVEMARRSRWCMDEFLLSVVVAGCVINAVPVPGPARLRWLTSGCDVRRLALRAVHDFYSCSVAVWPCSGRLQTVRRPVSGRSENCIGRVPAIDSMKRLQTGIDSVHNLSFKGALLVQVSGVNTPDASLGEGRHSSLLASLNFDVLPASSCYKAGALLRTPQLCRKS